MDYPINSWDILIYLVTYQDNHERSSLKENVQRLWKVQFGRKTQMNKRVQYATSVVERLGYSIMVEVIGYIIQSELIGNNKRTNGNDLFVTYFG